jgi:hypothetical protein
MIIHSEKDMKYQNWSHESNEQVMTIEVLNLNRACSFSTKDVLKARDVLQRTFPKSFGTGNLSRIRCGKVQISYIAHHNSIT